MSQPVNPYEPPREITDRVDRESDDTHSSVVIPYSGKLSVQDVKQAIRLMRKRNGKFSAREDRIALTFALALLIGFCIYSIFSFATGSISLVTFIPWIALFLAIVIPRLSNRRLNKQWAKGTGYFVQVNGQVDWHSFKVKTEHSSGEVRWSNFRGYRCSERVVILFEDFPNIIAIHSRNRFEKNDWEAFLQLVAEKLPSV